LLHGPANRLRNILHIGRLQSGQAAAEHRIDRKLAKELEDGSEKRVIRSEHHRRADEKRPDERSPDRHFAFAALSDVARWGGGIGADSRDVNEPIDSSTVCLSRYPLRRLDVNGMKNLLSALDVKANRIYHAVGPGERVRD
jgi:hypothetical protein